MKYVYVPSGNHVVETSYCCSEMTSPKGWLVQKIFSSILFNYIRTHYLLLLLERGCSSIVSSSGTEARGFESPLVCKELGNSTLQCCYFMTQLASLMSWYVEEKQIPNSSAQQKCTKKLIFLESGSLEKMHQKRIFI
jgi:hypothetical protein